MSRAAPARRTGPIRVLVVDDSVVIRRLVTDVLAADPQIEVVGTAVNGKVALAKIAALDPDVLTLDIEMPEMDGIATLRALQTDHRHLPVIMFSTLTERGAASTLEALSAGACDYVTKPANMGSVSESMASVRDQLIPKIHAVTGRRRSAGTRAVAPSASSSGAPFSTRATAPVAHKAAPHTATFDVRRRAPRVLAIGCSTGGPQALTEVLSGLSATFPLPIVVVQHMPPVFTAQFAARLDRTCAVRVVEARSEQLLTPGTVYLAPGDHHLELTGDRGPVMTRLHQGPQVAFCRPSVDVLFASVARVFDGAALAVVLTGMGQDGRDGAALIRRRGGSVVVQDEATSVVWGMPGAVASAGLADEILPLAAIAPAVTRLARTPSVATVVPS